MDYDDDSDYHLEMPPDLGVMTPDEKVERFLTMA